MLGLIVAFDPIKMEYLIEDVSEDEEDDFGRRKRFSVTWKMVQALPENDAAAIKVREFCVGDDVLALFPTTTCLYRGRVVGAPIKRKKSWDYLVQFENDDIDGMVPSRPVPARYVLDWMPSK
jgi:SAGA-associated factor 29